MTDTTPHPVISAESDEPVIYVVHQKLTEPDLRRVLFDYWSRVGGNTWHASTGARMLVTIAMMLLVLGPYAFFLLITPAFSRETTLAVSALPFLGGMMVLQALTIVKSHSIHSRLARQQWERVSVETLDVSFTVTASQFRIQRGEDLVEFLWVDIKGMHIAYGKALWYIVTDRGLWWVSLTAFTSKSDFERFADDAWELWKAQRPSGSAFEVIAKPA